jgi:hypothetical protein
MLQFRLNAIRFDRKRMAVQQAQPQGYTYDDASTGA